MIVNWLAVMAQWLLALVWEICRQEPHLIKDGAMRRGFLNLKMNDYPSAHRMINYVLIKFTLNGNVLK
jgi:hypothetical protein